MRPRLALVLVVSLAACGGGDDAGTPATSAIGGTATYCATEGMSGTEGTAVSRFGRAHRDEGLTARFRLIGAGPAIPDACDVALIDAAWIGPLAASGAIADLTARVVRRKADFMPATLEMAHYDDRYWGLPRFADVGFIYYRSNAGTPPFTWQEAYALGRRRGGFLYAGARGEDLTTHFLEVAYAAGGRVLSEDGTASELDSPANLSALAFMRRGITSGAVPREVTRMDAEAVRRAFDRGRSIMRNWSYAYAVSGIQDYKPLKTTDLVPLPAFGDGEPTTLVSGHDVVVAQDSRDEPAALALAEYLTGRDQAHLLVERFQAPSALTESHRDGAVDPYLDYSIELEQALEAGRPRPVTMHWPEISRAIAGNVHAALTGRTTPRAALRAAHREINAILAG